MSELTGAATDATQATNDYSGVMFQTASNAIPTTLGHYYNINADLAAVAWRGDSGVNCATTNGSPINSDPLLTFSLLPDSGTPIVLSKGLNLCTTIGHKIIAPNGSFGIMVAQLSSQALQWTGGASMGLLLQNATTDGAHGNDAALDNVQVVDATPQLDKSFNPPLITAGQNTNLVYTITNTNELNEKKGWGFLDNLPYGVLATGVNSTTCAVAAATPDVPASGATPDQPAQAATSVITAAAGSASVKMTNGDLASAGTSCTVTVQVTSTYPGTFVNGPANFPTGTAGLNGLYPPADATLTVIPPTTLGIDKFSNVTAITTVGQKIPYSFRVTNRATGTLNNLVIVDKQTAPALDSGLSTIVCPVASLKAGDNELCTAVYTVTQADLTNGSLTDTATVSGTDAQNNTITSLPSPFNINTPTAAISVVKSTTTKIVTSVGQSVPYSFLVSNDGNVDVSGVVVTDTVALPSTQGNLSKISCQSTTIKVGASETCTATYTATQDDLDNGTVADTATVSAVDPSSNPVTSDPSSISIPSQNTAVPTIVKSSSNQSISSAGQVITYSFLVTNNGALPITSLTIADTQLTPANQRNLSTITCQVTSLLPKDFTTCKATYTVSLIDMNNGQAADSAVATGITGAGTPAEASTSSTPSVLTLLTPTPGLTVLKQSTVGVVTSVGQVIPYTFLVTNTGNRAIDTIAVTDTVSSPSDQNNVSAMSCPVTSLAAGASTTCNNTYTTIAADLTAAAVNDFAVATGQTTPTTAVPTVVSVTTPASYASIPVATSAITLQKFTNDTAVTSIGQVINYLFTVTNTSAADELNPAVVDTVVAPSLPGNMSAVKCPDLTLASAQSTTCTATYTTTAADLDNGVVTNSAVANAVSGTATTYSGVSLTAIPVTVVPTLSVKKVADTTAITTVGQKVTYTYTVTNTGSITLNKIGVADVVTAPSLPGDLTSPTCLAPSLAHGAVTTCTAVYTVTQADLDHGTVADTATAAGTPPATSLYPNPVTVYSAGAPLSTDVTQSPLLTVVKATATSGVKASTVGQKIDYTFTITNTGNVTLSAVGFTDTVTAPSLPADLLATACPSTTLAPTASTVCKATYTVTQADLDNGSVNDTASAQGTGPVTAANPKPTASTAKSNSASVPVDVTSTLSLVKKSTTTAVTTLGESVPYDFVVTNNTNVTITGISITDTVTKPSTQANLVVNACPQTTLAPGASTTCTGTYKVTQADLDNGSVADSAVATGTDSNKATVTSAAATKSITVTQAKSLLLTKSVLPTTASKAGDAVVYSFAVKNTGNVTETAIAITESAFSGSPALTIKCPTGTGSGTGTATLAPGDTVTCTADYTVVQADVNTGSVTNTAHASGTSPQGSAVVSNDSSAKVTIAANPSISIVGSTASKTVSKVGDSIDYSFTVTNTGNVPLTGVTPTPGSFTGTGTTPVISCTPAAPTTLAPGATQTCTATYVVTQQDVDNGSVIDTLGATGTPASGSAVTAATPAAPKVTAAAAPSLTVKKTATPLTVAAVGDIISYKFLVTNTGNVTLNPVTVTDVQANKGSAAVTPVCTPTSLAPNTSVTCTATYTVTQADLDAGSVGDTASAQGTGPTPTGGTAPKATPADATSSASSSATSSPGISVAKSVVATSPATTITKAGQVIPYQFVVTNTGNVSLTNVTVTDTQAAAGSATVTTSCPTNTLAPGKSLTCTANYTVTQADVDRGSVTDTASASGTPPTGSPVVSSPTDKNATVTVDITAAPALTVIKSAKPTTVAKAGDTVVYSFLVENTGNVTLSSIGVSDVAGSVAGGAALATPSCSTTSAPVTLAPGATVTCTADYTVTQADVNAGSFTDTAVASGTGPTQGSTAPNATTSEPSSATVTAASSGTLTLDKTVSPRKGVVVGTKLTYSFLITNDSNVTVTNVGVTEGTFTGTGKGTAGLSTPSCTGTPITLNPGETANCTATYVVNQADINNGDVDNTATAQGTTPSNTTMKSASSDADLPITAAPALTLSELSSPSTVSKAGDAVNYSFTVTNTGNVTMTGVGVTDTVTDSGTPIAVICTPTTLDPGAKATCTATYKATQVDIDRGSFTDSAVAQATGPTPTGGTAPKATSSNTSGGTVTAKAAPALSVKKSALPIAITAPNQKITYTFDVTNDGNVTLNPITISDVQSTSGSAAVNATCPPGGLAPADTVSCKGTYTSTQQDVDNGSITDTATATGTGPTQNGVAAKPVTSKSDSATVTAKANPSLTVVSSALPKTVSKAGDKISYSFLVKNTGNVTLTDVNVTDVQTNAGSAGVTVDCPSPSLNVGDSETCTATYTVTQADIDHGSIDNTAVAHATPPTPTGGSAQKPVDSTDSGSSVTAPATPSVTVVKSASPSTISAVGTQVVYSFTVKNTGNVTLSAVSVADTQAAADSAAVTVACPETTLAPGISTTCTGDYTVTQADVNRGSLSDSAVASATTPAGKPVGSDPKDKNSTVTETITPDPSVTVVKSASPASITTAGQVVTYSFVVTNTGNVTITGVSVTDVQATPGAAAVTPQCPSSTLDSGQSVTCTATYTVTQTDIDNGSFADTATAAGTTPTGDPVTSSPTDPNSGLKTAVVAAPALTVVKSASPSTITTAGQTVDYTFVVTNSGNVTLTSVTLTDVQANTAATPVIPACEKSTLAPGESETCTATYTATQADVDNGSFADTATATGTGPTPTGGIAPDPISSTGSTASVTTTQAPGLSVAATADATQVTAVGQVVHYAFRITNTGNVTMSNVAISESNFSGTGPVPAITCTPALGTLAVGASVTCTASYTVTAADVKVGHLSNTAVIGGTSGISKAVLTSAPSTITIPMSAALIAVDLAFTGGSIPWMVVWGSLTALIIGLALMLIARRRRNTHEITLRGSANNE